MLVQSKFVLIGCLLFVLLQASHVSAKRYKTVTSEKNPRIINGTLAELADTKHQVSIRRKLNDGFFFGTGHICGGSLIAPNVVLSAAHCFVDQYIYDGTFLPPTDFIAVMGMLDRYEKDDNTLIYEVIDIVYDGLEKFNLSTYDKDIALVYLNSSIPANHSTVETIVLNRDPAKTGEMCQVTGWGLTEDGYLSDELMTVDVPIIDFNVCSNETDFNEGAILSGMLCAGYLEQGEKDACGGDSGGPLVCHKLLSGIVSWGYGCALPSLPGVYTDVASYASWIDTQLKAINVTIPGGGSGGNNSTNGTKPGGGGAENHFNHSLTFISFIMAAIVVLIGMK